MSGGLAAARLSQERKTWRKDHPFGFVAKPETEADGTINMFRWQCKIPGKDGTAWEGGLYPITLQFGSEYPSAPPKCKFPAGFVHPNVFPCGSVCLSIINPQKGWHPNITVKQILMGIQELLHSPNIDDPANQIYQIYKRNIQQYNSMVKEQKKRYSAETQL